MDTLLERGIRGAIAGVAGGLAMTGMVWKVAPHVIPEDMRPDEFVPKKAVRWAEEQMGHPDALTKEQEQAAAMGAHLGYSALMGALFGLAQPKLEGLPTPVAGVAFGLAVWALSFEGLMPVLGIMERTTDKPMKKWPPPIMGHVVYGNTTAFAFDALEGVLDGGGNTPNRNTRGPRASL